MRHCHRQCGLLVPSRLSHAEKLGFTLIELLLVIVIIGVMSAMIITMVSNAARDTWRVVATQQQVTVQDALNAWVAANCCGTNTLQTARSNYNAISKLTLLSNYLHADTYARLVSANSTASQIRTEEMNKAGFHLEFSTWTTNNNDYPKVEKHTN